MLVYHSLNRKALVNHEAMCLGLSLRVPSPYLKVYTMVVLSTAEHHLLN